MTEKKSLVEEALLQMKNLEQVVAENAKGILASTMKEEISELVKESLKNEAEDESMGIEMDDESEDDLDMDMDMDSDDENMDDVEMDFDMDSDDDESDDELEMDFDMDSDDTLPIDLTNASDDEILKVFKFIKTVSIRIITWIQKYYNNFLTPITHLKSFKHIIK